MLNHKGPPHSTYTLSSSTEIHTFQDNYMKHKDSAVKDKYGQQKENNDKSVKM